MAEYVWLVHPNLPGQPIRVREQAVPTYRASGWQVEPTPEPEAEAAEEKPRRRPRNTPKEMSTDGADAA
jgi:hypothetical protein